MALAELDWDFIARQNGLVPREYIREFVKDATDSAVEVIFLEPGQVCMYNGNFFGEVPYSSGTKATQDDALLESLHALLDSLNGRNVIALRQAVVTNQMGIRFWNANILAASYTKKK